MLTNLFAGLFHRRCPLCKQEVPRPGSTAVQRFGKWFCSKRHADLYEFDLYEALRSVHYQHAARHGEHIPLPEAARMSFSPRPRMALAHAEQDHEPCVSVHG
jgi:hypothetical protein